MFGSIVQDFKTTVQQTTTEVFMSAALEHDYLIFKSRKVLQQRRLAMLLAIFSWTSFFYWDAVYHSDFANIHWIFVARTVGLVFLTFCFIATFSPVFLVEKFAEAVLLAAAVVTWILVVAMMLVCPAPSNYLDYYMGLTMIYVFLFTFIWVQAKRAVVLGIVLAIVFNLAQWYMYEEWGFYTDHHGIERDVYQANFRQYWFVATFYITSFLLLCGIVNYQLERSLRLDFVRARELADQARQDEAHAQVLLNLKEQQRRLAIEASEKKSSFLAFAAHDLRQPLMAVGAMVEALEHSIDDGDLQTSGEHIALARRAVRALGVTLNAVLEVSRLESGVVTPEYSEFDVAELLLEVCEPMLLMACNKGIEFRLRIPVGVRILVRSDPVLLARLVTNLVSNAVKYTPPKPVGRAAVLVGLVRLGNRVRIDVVDTGLGVAHAHHEVIFRPFFQLDNKRRDREKGLGLGLSIVAQIVAILDHHRLDFASTPGRGSRFSVELPILEVKAVLQPLTIDDTRVDTDPLAGSYILIVEDDVLVLQALAAALRSWGALVETCEDMGQLTGFLRTAQRYPDLVLSDFNLPDGCNAYDAIGAVRAFVRSDVPAVVLTGEVRLGAMLDIPLAWVVPKPVDMKVLKQRLAASLAQT